MKFLMILALFLLSAEAADISVLKKEYSKNEKITVKVTQVDGKANNWVGIFHKGDQNSWSNVVLDNWFYDKNATLVFNPLEAGEYEARLFYDDTVNPAIKSASFVVKGDPLKFISSKNSYDKNESIKIVYENITGRKNNWIGVFKKGAQNEWYEVLQDFWLKNKKGEAVFKPLPAGKYEARLFYDDSLKQEAVVSFSVKEQPVSISATKKIYKENEPIYIDVKNVQGVRDNWVGIYEKGASENWYSVIAENWFYESDAKLKFSPLLPGEYEARLCYNGSLKPEVVAEFSVEAIETDLPPTLYEDAQDGTTKGWITMEGPYKVENRFTGGSRTIFGKAAWRGHNGERYTYNAGWYMLKNDDLTPWNNTRQHILDLDVHGYTACYQVGVEVKTKLGYRGIYFSLWFGRNGWGPQKSVYNGYTELVYPLSIEYLREGWHHLRIDLQKKLEILEPGNKILSVEAFILNGQTADGAIDNIKLLSK